MKRRLITSIIGIIIYAVSINNLVAINIGVRSQDLFIETLEKMLNVNQYAFVYFSFELVFLIILLIYYKPLNITKHEFTISFISILFLSLLIKYTTKFVFFSSTYISFIVIMLILNFGLYLITQGNLIITPLDKLLVHLSIKYQTSYGKMRLLLDIGLIILSELISLIAFKANVITLPLIACTLMSGPIVHLYESLFSVHTVKSRLPRSKPNKTLHK